MSTYSLTEMVADLQAQMDDAVKLATYLQHQNEELANELSVLRVQKSEQSSTESEADIISLKKNLVKVERERDEYRSSIEEMNGGKSIGILITDVYQKLNAVIDERNDALEKLKAYEEKSEKPHVYKEKAVEGSKIVQEVDDDQLQKEKDNSITKTVEQGENGGTVTTTVEKKNNGTVTTTIERRRVKRIIAS